MSVLMSVLGFRLSGVARGALPTRTRRGWGRGGCGEASSTGRELEQLVIWLIPGTRFIIKLCEIIRRPWVERTLRETGEAEERGRAGPARALDTTLLHTQ